MQIEKKARITNTSLNDMATSFFEQGERKGHFNTIAHLPLGYGSSNCVDTEAECYQSISFFIKAAEDEGSKVFILGFAPQVIPALWIKTAELIIQGSEVEIILIPIAKKVRDGWNPIILGNLLYVRDGGIFDVEQMGELRAGDFWAQVAEKAMSLNQGVLVTT